MSQSKFHSDFTGMTHGGAKWLVQNTNIKLVSVLRFLSQVQYGR
jgi:hypothetical protein